MKQQDGFFSPYTMNFTALKAAKFLFSITLILLIAHCISFFLFFTLPVQHITLLLTKLFDVGRDYNVPTLFSSFLLLMASILLFYIYRQKKAGSGKKADYRWLVLSIIFFYLAIDEYARIHEELMETVHSRLHIKLTGYLFVPWVIPYALFTLVVFIYFFRFVLNLPKKTSNLIFIAGFIYVAGALGFEMLEAHELEINGRNVLVHLQETIEETMEMCGVIIFIYSLLDYVAPRSIKIKIVHTEDNNQGNEYTQKDPDRANVSSL